jgi:nucleotide-binding universal stress UspA family protein
MNDLKRKSIERWENEGGALLPKDCSVHFWKHRNPGPRICDDRDRESLRDVTVAPAFHEIQRRSKDRKDSTCAVKTRIDKQHRRKNIMRIICGTDFSIHANSAALASATLAARLDLPLRLVHVVDPAQYSNPSSELMAYLRNGRQQKLQVLAERAGRKGVIVETAIIEGSPAEKLAQFADETQARVLVVSAIGQIAPTQWLAGSITDQVVQMSKVPTLILRDAGSFESWLQRERALKILVGYDYSATAEAAIRWVGSLAAIAPCDITVAYVASPANERSRLGTPTPLSREYYSSSLRQFLEAEIKQNCGPMLGNGARVYVKADWGRPDSQLVEIAADSNVDLTVVGMSRRRGFARLGSVARAVVHYAKTNVASVPDGWVAPASEETQRPGVKSQGAEIDLNACELV